MSTVIDITATPDPVQPQRRVLDEPTRRAIVARVMECRSIVKTAQEFSVHTNTVSRLMRSVRKVRNDAVEGWRQRLVNELPTKSVDAIERSIDDKADVHRAAATAIQHLKGIGALQNDSVNVTVATLISAVPQDWQDRYVSSAHPIVSPSHDTDKPITSGVPDQSSE